ncbi:nuclear transport factor 2 family protein [Paraburkholderia sp. J41]|uniref:nuclear transport factor 2 family protein n=1 Tax=Paraburkholderia sp. J41 TaxID=2805433 RepID=UPI002AC36951|nr:nuclear transport factor 2 family protein [Paraburkholderia sp. J41]
MKRILLASLLISMASMASAQAVPPASDEAAILSLENTWAQAVSSGDRTTVDRILDDSFVETGTTGSHRSKREMLVAPPPPAGSTQALQDCEVRMVGDVGVVTGTNVFKLSSAATPVRFLFTDVFVRRGNTWRAVYSKMVRSNEQDFKLAH